MELLRFTTAGSVDDGKSTLIGRMLYEARGVYEDQLASVRNSAVNRSTGPIDFSLLTDGLRAEREQGITIDVAYRYFATPKRKFIIADTPGHEQYTRNMATGASTADLAIVLIDSRKGLLPQSRRHAFIASLLGIPHVAVAVNKMDLVAYSKDVFDSIVESFTQFASRIGLRDMQFIPVSALEGDNIVKPSVNMPWYQGPPLLEYLETVPLIDSRNFISLRFPVQFVIRPDLDFRGYAGQLAAGVLKPGQKVMALPSGRTTTVKSIPGFYGDLEEAYPPMSIAVCLEDEIDLSRGDMLVDPENPPVASKRIEADLVWMHAEPLATGKQYLIKHTSSQGSATVTEINYKLDVNMLAELPANELHLNEIGLVTIESRRALFFDPYSENRYTGSFVLIDPNSNATVAAGMIRRQAPVKFAGRVEEIERIARYGNRGVVIPLHGRSGLALLLERQLFDRGCLVCVVDRDAGPLAEAGMIAISIADPGPVRHVLAFGHLSTNDHEAAKVVMDALENSSYLLHPDDFAQGDGI